jgi:hypothetical protein
MFPPLPPFWVIFFFFLEILRNSNRTRTGIELTYLRLNLGLEEVLHLTCKMEKSFWKKIFAEILPLYY